MNDRRKSKTLFQKYGNRDIATVASIIRTPFSAILSDQVFISVNFKSKSLIRLILTTGQIYSQELTFLYPTDKL